MKSKSELIEVEKSPWTPDQIKLIRDVVARGATDDELKLFLYRAKNMGLDPLKPGQIYFIKYGNSPGTIVVGIEGFRTRAGSTGKLAGIKRGILRDEKGKCTGAYADVYRSDWKEPAHEEVSLAEYNTGKGNWSRMPETMIKKVAEAAALRMAFPGELGGIYSDEEMEQAKGGVYPEQPGPNDGDPNAFHEYKVPFGKYVQRKLWEIPDLKDYLIKCEARVAKKPDVKPGKPGEWEDFVFRAEQYLADLENAPVETSLVEQGDI